MQRAALWSSGAVVAALLGVAVAVSAPPAFSSSQAPSSTVYWGGAYGSVLGRTSHTGRTSLLAKPLSPNPCGIAADRRYVYWSDNASTGAISRATYDGRRSKFRDLRRSFIRAGADCSDVAVSATHIYWTSGAHTIGRARLDGKEINRSFIRDEDITISSLALNDTYLYWGGEITGGFGTRGGAIGRAGIDGSSPTPLFLVLSRYYGSGLAANDQYLFWSNDDAISRASTEGADVVPVLLEWKFGDGYFGGLAVDSTHLYWSSYDGPVGRSALDGSDARPTFIRTRGRLQGAAEVAVVER